MKKIYIPLVSLSLFGLSSCDKFLDELPDNRTEIDTVEEVQELLVSAYPNGLYMDIAETMSDNASDKVTLPESSPLNTDLYTWRGSNETTRDTPVFYWTAAYNAIASANQALASLEQMKGGNTQKFLKGEALVARAYAHFMLAYLWCKPFNPATAATDLGLPYVDKPETVVFGKYKRISLEAFYNAIEKDLNEGLPLIDNTKYSKPKFHFTKEAAHAFATRFYLYKGDWDKVIEHADAILGSNPQSKLRNEKVQQKSLTALQKREQNSSSAEVSNLLIAGVLSQYQFRQTSNKYGMTYDLMNNQIINARTHPLNLSWAYTVYGATVNNQNLLKFQPYYTDMNVSAGTGVPHTMVTLLSYDEVILNRMEAYLMKNEYTKFLDDLKVFLPVKTEADFNTSDLTESVIETKYNGKGTDLDPAYTLNSRQRVWLACLLDLRRVQFAFEGLRWFDNKRLGMKITHLKDGATIELPKNDPRRELQLPDYAIKQGLTANPR